MKQLYLSVGVLLLTGCLPTKVPEQNIALIGPDKTAITVTVELANSVEERAQGLMNRESLAEGHGMLFYFDEPQVLSFWMKNTLIPLDIMFFDAGGQFVSSATMEPCTTPECPTYSSTKEAQVAIEVNKGFINRYGIGSGWVLGLPTSGIE